MTHAELVKLAENWLLRTRRCGFAFTELHTYCTEIPDAIGFHSGLSILIECKASRADFLGDHKKKFRKNPKLGLGAFRFYMCPSGLIAPHELPARWGLIWATGSTCRMKVGPRGNTWSTGSPFYFPERNERGERILMQSALRRLYLRGVLPMIYDKPYLKRRRKRRKNR